MKIIINYTTHFMCIFLFSFLLIACNTEDATKDYEHLRNLELENQLNNLDNFSKRITVKNIVANNQGVTHVDFIIKSNDESVINAVNENSIILKLGEFTSEYDDLTFFGNEEEYEDPKVNLHGIEPGRSFIQIIALGSTIMPTDESKMNYSISFGNDLLDMMESKNLASIIDFGADEHTFDKETKHQDIWRWWRNKLLVLDSAHNTRTKSNNYWAFTSQSRTYYLNYRDISEIGTTAVCCMYNKDRWVRRVVAFQGRYAAVNGIWFYCESGTCGSNFPH